MRGFFLGILAANCALFGAFAGTSQPISVVRSDLLADAKAAFAVHSGDISNQNAIIIVDYARHSAKERLYIIDLKTETTTAFRVSHGRGSDPDHDGLLDTFSSKPGSYASPSGAHVTAEQYVGRHGKSIRMDGLEPGNANARGRAIVIHAADYAEPSMVNKYGKLGRSQGCLALSASDLRRFLDKVPPGTLVYIDK